MYHDRDNLYDDFYDMVVAVVLEIPKGYVSTYGEIAKMIGYPKNARKVGTIMSRIYESGIPCHRVVNASGELAPYHVFKGEQKELLESEGVTFLKNGKINMKKHLWNE